jgi:hypothetical protein
VSTKTLEIANHRQTASQSRFPSVGVHSRCVLCRSESDEQILVPQLPAPIAASLRPFPLVLGFVAEMHSLLHRMALRRRLRSASYFLSIPPEEMAERLAPHTRTHAYMQDMRNFVARYPWATILDLEMYRDAWLAGAEWGSHMHKQGQGTSQCQA